MKPTRILPLVAVLIACVSGIAQRQSTQYDTGLMPFQSYHGGNLDAVSIANGNLYIDIPLFGYPQRGSKLKLSYSVRFNAKYLTQEAICNDPQDPTDCYNILTHANTASTPSTAGWKIIDDQQISPLNLHYNATKPGTSQMATYFPMEVMTPDGGLHYGGELSGSNMQIALDGSGLLSQNPLNNYSIGAGTEYIDKSGVVYGPANVSGASREDSDGNYISSNGFSPGGNTFYGATDSLGRVIPATITASSTSSCTGPNPITSATSWTVPTFNGGTAAYLFCYATVTLYVPAADCSNLTFDYSGSETVLQSIVLPNGTAWTFEYQARGPSEATNVNYGELTKVTTPLGGTLSYQYKMTEAPSSIACSAWVTSRTLDANDGSGPHTWSYSWALSTGNQNIVTAPDQTYVSHTMLGSQEISTQYYDAANNLQKRVDTQYVPSVAALNDWEWDNDNGISTINKFPLSVTTTLDNGLVSKKVFGYCCTYSLYDFVTGGTGHASLSQASASYGLPSDVKEYAFGQGSPGPLMRETSTQYLWSSNSSYQNANLLDTVSSTTVFDGSSNQAAMTSYTYDEANLLTASNVTTGHTSSPQGVRGHVTTVTDWLSGGTNPQTTTNWYDTGVPYIQTDAGGHATTYGYSSTYSEAYITSIQNALGQTRTMVYDSNTGLIASESDLNGNVTAHSYDNMSRSIQTLFPNVDSAGNHGETDITYSASDPTYVKIANRLQGSTFTDSRVRMDGLGRVRQAAIANGNNGSPYDLSDTCYDSMGRSTFRSYAHAGAGLISASTPSQCSAAGDNLSYDALGRPSRVTHPDGTYATTTYAGATVDSWDEAGVHMQHSSDALGRLVQVKELGTASSPLSLSTAYTYNVSGNLTNVGQAGASGDTARNRSFSYDSLSRLTSSTNPETGNIGYSYLNANGQLCAGDVSLPCSKTDTRGVTASYNYDALNRLTLKTFSDGTWPNSFTYDGYLWDGRLATQIGIPAGNPIGKLTDIDNRAVSGVIYSYDAMGRATAMSQYLPKEAWAGTNVSAQYDLAGNMTDLTYPDGHHLKQTFDSGGRLATSYLADINGVPATQSYVAGMSYFPDGSPNAMTLGNNVVQTIEKNNRLQVQGMCVSMSAGPCASLSSSFLSHTYSYANPGGTTGNNGNIYGIADNLNGSRSQGFTYDALNRIASFSLGGTLNQKYGIDSFGNMTQMAWSNPINTFDQATNRIANLPCASFVPGYDAVGNQLCSTDQNGIATQLAYDGDNRIKTINACCGQSPSTSYTYGGDGARVLKYNADASYTEYVAFNGQTVAELNHTPGQSSTWTDYVYAGGQKIARIMPPPASFAQITVRFPNDSCSACSGVAPNQDRNLYVGSVSVGSTTVSGTNSSITYTACSNPGELVCSGDMIVPISGSGAVTVTAYGSPDFGVYPHMQVLVNGVVAGEWDVNGTMQSYSTPATGGSTYFMLADHLGTAALEFSAGGWLEWEGQFAPFGGELHNGVPVVADQPDPTTGNHYKFTGKERDTESGLDYFGARYYASSMGRFMSPDWSAQEEPVPYAKLDDPQSLNLYGYVRNNPLSMADPDGHDGCCQALSDFITGFSGATVSDSLGGLRDRGTPDSSAGRAGAFFGDVHAALQGASEVETGVAGMGLGGGEAVVTSETVVLAIPGVAVAAGSAVLTAHGAATFMAAAKNLTGGGRNDQKANEARQKAADAKVTNAKEQLEKAKQGDPSKERSQNIRDAEKRVKHWTKKAAETSENHSRKAKGSN